MIIDQRGWAHDFKSQNLRRLLADEFDISIVLQNEVTNFEVRRADIVLIYYWNQTDRLEARGVQLPLRGTAVGICSHHSFSDDARETGIARTRKYAEVVFVNSRLLFQEFGNLFDVPVFYTPNGVDTSFYEPSASSSRPAAVPLRIGWAGSLTNHGSKRGFDDFIVPAVAQAQGELVVAAREDRWRGPEEMREFYQSLDVYVCASRTEGTPNPCLEASACGVPVVTTPVGNMPEFIVDGVNGFLVARDVDSIARALDQLRDEGRRLEMSSQARAAAESWDWSVHAEHYREMFRSILASRA